MRSSDGPSKLFVAGLGDNRKSDLSRVFSKYGDVLNVYVDEKKQFAFVEYGSPANAQQALQHVNHMKVNGSRLRVEFARSEKGSRDSRRSPLREPAFAHNHYESAQASSSRTGSSSGYRPGPYSYPPSSMLVSGTGMPRGRSLTPPSLKRSGSFPMVPPDFYPTFYPNFYMDSSYYRPYDDPYMMARFPTFPSRPHGHSFGSRDFTHYSSRGSHRRSPSRNRPRTPPTHRDRYHRDDRQRKIASRSISPRDRSPRAGTHRSKKRSRSNSSVHISTAEQKVSSESSADEEEPQKPHYRSHENNSNQFAKKRRQD